MHILFSNCVTFIANKLTSSYRSFHKEVEFQRSLFINKMYLAKVFNYVPKKFLHERYTSRVPAITVPRKDTTNAFHIGKQSTALEFNNQVLSSN